MPTIQKFSLILPQWQLHFAGTETEAIDDLVIHYSQDIPTAFLGQKRATILATEVVAAGIPGTINFWVELSPVPSTVSTAYFAAIGGGGGALAPVAPLTFPGIGVHLTPHTEFIAWTVWSEYARVCVQTPIAAGLPNAQWAVQVIFEGGTY